MESPYAFCTVQLKYAPCTVSQLDRLRFDSFSLCARFHEKMADGVDIDLYADDLEQDLQVSRFH